ncbi:MAG: hypothetical protein NXI16_08385 [Alphaproteobacteria bacterium]|nr:hypothetical protein [Alphaproteobacteria bacterium]
MGGSTPRYASKRGLAVRDGRIIGDKPARLTQEKDPALFSHTLQTFIRGQRARVSRLIAGNVQVIDLGANPDPAARAEAVELAMTLAETILNPLDIIVPCGNDGLILLFDSDTADDAEAVTDQLALRLTNALRHRKGLERLKATAHTFDLAHYADLDLIGTVEDLVAAAQGAFRACMLERRGQSKISLNHQLCFGPVIAPKRRLMVGYQVGLCTADRDGLMPVAEPCLGRNSSRSEAAQTAERAAAKIELLGEIVGGTDSIPNVLFFVTVCASILDLPLALRNLHHEIAMLPPAVQRRLVLCVDMRHAANPGKVVAATAEKLAGCGRGLFAYVDPDFGPLADLEETGFIGIRVDPGTGSGVKSLMDSARRAGLRRFCFDDGGANGGVDGGEVSGPALLKTGADYVGGPGLLKPVAAPTQTLTLH